MTNKVEISFKFNVGDLVLPAELIHLLHKSVDYFWRVNSPDNVRYRVIERFYQECYNTFQIFYDIRYISSGGDFGTQTNRIQESCLVSAPPFETKEERAKRKEAYKKDSDK